MQEVLLKYPGLRHTSDGVLEGAIGINHQYGACVRQDAFLIQLAAPSATSRLPTLREIGGRTGAIVRKHGLEDAKALHQNAVDGSACVCVRQEENERFPPGASLLTFIERLVVPYLFGLSYADEFGKWPWGEYSHGELGLLEFYADRLGHGTKEEFKKVLSSLKNSSGWADYRRQLKNPSSKKLCVCGSEMAFGKCHRRAWRGLKNFATALKRAGLDIDA